MEQKLKQAKQQSLIGQKQFASKNYQAAFHAYNKTVTLLIDYLQKQPYDQSRQEIMKQINKYIQLRTQAQQLMIKNPKGGIQYANQNQNNKPNQEKHKIQPLFINPINPVQHNSLNINPQQNTFETLFGKAPIHSIILQQPKEKPIQPKKYQNNLHQNNKKQQIHNKKQQFEFKKPQINLKDIPQDIRDLIINDTKVRFSDIVGLKEVKDSLQQAVIRPRKRPDLYKGIRAPPKGLLLYGPPGNGKTYICKALANESGCTFFALSASSILNKYVGESQKMIKKVFATAAKCHPSIVFIDEIDSMLTSRSQGEHESSRRLKTQFLVLMDGINSPQAGNVIVIGATNLPKELDSAAKRRFAKFIYIGPPDAEARRQIILKNLKQLNFNIPENEMKIIIDKLDGFSASQIRNIVAQASALPLRQLSNSNFLKIECSKIRDINVNDFLNIIKERKPIVSKEQIQKFKTYI